MKQQMIQYRNTLNIKIIIKIKIYTLFLFICTLYYKYISII